MTRLVDEGVIIVGAGTDTTANTLEVTTFYILNTPQALQNLVKELDEAIPNPSNPPSWQKLEQLPYLRATILEGHRITSLMTSRLIRVPTNEVLRYNDWSIPAGTPVSMTTHFTHYDPAIFPSPLEFRPERFLGSSELEKYVVPFSKGSRACLGIK